MVPNRGFTCWTSLPTFSLTFLPDLRTCAVMICFKILIYFWGKTVWKLINVKLSGIFFVELYLRQALPQWHCSGDVCHGCLCCKISLLQPGWIKIYLNHMYIYVVCTNPGNKAWVNQDISQSTTRSIYLQIQIYLNHIYNVFTNPERKACDSTYNMYKPRYILIIYIQHICTNP